MQLQTETGERIRIAQKLASGGEGAVYAVVGHGGLLAKVYHQPSKEHERKLHRMLQLRTDLLKDQFAWPRHLLFDGSEFVGFLQYT